MFTGHYRTNQSQTLLQINTLVWKILEEFQLPTDDTNQPITYFVTNKLQSLLIQMTSKDFRSLNFQTVLWLSDLIS